MHRYLTRAALVVLGGAVALATTGCAPTGGPGTGPATSAPVTGEDGLGSAPEPGAPDAPVTDPSPTTGGGAQGGGPTGGGSTGGGQQGGHGQQTKPPGHPPQTSAPAGPTILVFRITQKPQCPQGTSVNPIPGVPVVLSWKVSGTDTVTLSVDGGGIYDSYPAEGGTTVNFPCSGAPGEKVTHTYQLRTVGGGEVRSKTLTASATVHDIPQV